jgi:hypothetical protein
VSVCARDQLPNCLDEDQLRHLDIDPEWLRRVGLTEYTGLDGRPCWLREHVQEWVESRPE